MAVYYIDDHGCDYSCGVIIVIAHSKKEAFELMKKECSYFEESTYETTKNDIEVLKWGIVIDVHGGS